jgi:hypothetical protein
LLLINFVLMNKEVKLLLVAGVGYLGFKAYQIYTALKKLSYAPTGINFSIIKERGAIGGTLFVDIINPTAATINVDGFTGTVTTASGTLIGDYKGTALALKPGSNNVRISWGSRSTTTLIPLALGIVRGQYPVLKFNTVFNVKGFPIPTSFAMNTKDYAPVLK